MLFRSLREDISKGTDKALDQADDYLGTAREKGQDVVEDVEDKASSYFNVAGDKIEDAADDVKDKVKK